MRRTCWFLLSLFLVAQLHAQLHKLSKHFLLGDERTEVYLPRLKNMRVALFSNQTGCNRHGKHTLDVMLEAGINVTTLFSPEHGFRGQADAGERVSSSVDEKTQLPIRSLYDGQRPGPSDEVMNEFDILVVDIQDVGTRFYTYYVTMLQLMERCGQTHRSVMILDRPNPNGHYVDGPILDMSLKSGVGALPIPIVHGMTLGELALMAQGEDWVQHPCDLTVIPCWCYDHQAFYPLPVKPSPNLPNICSILLYPSLCYFEGTCVSLGRGTSIPFQCYGHPSMPEGKFQFVPKSCPGAKHPPLMDQRCHGVNLSKLHPADIPSHIDLSYLIHAYNSLQMGDDFFLNGGAFFDKLMGQRYVREMILQGASASEIAARWQPDVERFRQLRSHYLLYH